MILGFVAFLFFLSYPFALNQINFFDGIGFYPIFQDPLLAIHPPVLYVGYVGFSLVFSLAIAGLFT
jgi:Cytochrome c biogenesis factor